MRTIVGLAFMTFNFILIRAEMYWSVCKASKRLKEYSYTNSLKFTVISQEHMWFLFYKVYLGSILLSETSVLFSLIQLVSESAISSFRTEAETSFSMVIAKNYSSLLFISFFIFIWVYNKTLNHTIAPSYFFFFSHLKWTWKPLAERLRNKKLLKLTKLF